MVLTDTPGKAFDKIGMDIVGPLPKTQRGNEYILTIQDLLTNLSIYSIGIPIEGISSAEIANVFVTNDLFANSGHRKPFLPTRERIFPR